MYQAEELGQAHSAIQGVLDALAAAIRWIADPTGLFGDAPPWLLKCIQRRHVRSWVGRSSSMTGRGSTGTHEEHSRNTDLYRDLGSGHNVNGSNCACNAATCLHHVRILRPPILIGSILVQWCVRPRS
ncbi:hypothetical protein PYCCODRAFT_1436499 [Trametes coccinea BRFM310]|uniref:Uncharacterized protein n=1 Tax=Trametes coccinea (strain BRFM310) TaxID=1353009 RepID=A0A1Y2IJC7_TRAC3|nr:hypothetical protein PYCCODRAFT_1436499 [Trametes coccinea BRFM310]